MTMATPSGILCGICDSQHITKSAEIWCPECEEGFCPDCKKHHSVSKVTRNHGIISVDQYQKLPSSISNIVHYCEEHQTKYTNYCTHHDILCCPICISTTHVACSGFSSVQEIIKTSKTSVLLDIMEQSLNDVERNMVKIIQNRKENLVEMKKQREKVNNEIKIIRDKINSHLAALEQNFMKELNAAEKKVTSEIESLLLRLSKEQTIAHQLKNNITALKEHGSDLQTFIGCQTYRQDVEKVEKYVESLSEDGSLNQMNVKFKTEEKIFDTLTQITTFGSISIETGPPTVAIKMEKDKQAQITGIIQQPSTKTINNIKHSLVKIYEIPKPRYDGYNGCIIHPDSKFIITEDSMSELVVLKTDGKLEKLPSAAYTAHDLTIINNRTVAVSTVKGIYTIHIETGKLHTVTRTIHWCYGITYHKGTLLWCQEYTGIQRVDLSDGSITTLIKQDKLPKYCYITTHGNNIYQTNHKNKTVTCYSITGEKQWEYTNGEVLADPTCITVDNDSYIYVTSPRSDSVVVLIPDGKEGRQFLGQSEGLNSPFGIFFDKTENNLLIVNKRGPAFLYRIS